MIRRAHVGLKIKAAVDLYSEDGDFIVSIGTFGFVQKYLPRQKLYEVNFMNGVKTYCTRDELNRGDTRFVYPLAVVN